MNYAILMGILVVTGTSAKDLEFFPSGIDYWKEAAKN